jgi:hypothetical protein
LTHFSVNETERLCYEHNYNKFGRVVLCEQFSSPLSTEMFSASVAAS